MRMGDLLKLVLLKQNKNGDWTVSLRQFTHVSLSLSIYIYICIQIYDDKVKQTKK